MRFDFLLISSIIKKAGNLKFPAFFVPFILIKKRNTLPIDKTLKFNFFTNMLLHFYLQKNS